MILLLNLFIACSGTAEKDNSSQEVTQTLTETSNTTATETTTETATEAAPDVGAESIGDGTLQPEDESPYRNKKRMSVHQVRETMVQASGGISWVEQNKERWEHYSDTLGVADYEQRIREERSPSVMFQKFLHDAALYTCSEWISLEITTEQRLFFAEIEPDDDDAANIRQNLAYLRHRIQGKKIDPNHPITDDLVDLHQLVMLRSNELEKAWKTVCVGLFTHPDFFMY